jgi:hypothetical protein
LRVSLGVSLAFGGLSFGAFAQDPAAASAVDPVAEPTTEYFETRMPLPPWLGSDALQEPEWVQGRAPAAPFLRPGLGTSSIGGSSMGGAYSGARPRSAPVRLGPIDLWPRLGYELTYGSGLLSGPGREEATWLNTVSPALTFAAGDHWTLGYAPDLRFYSADGYDDTVNHTVTLGWQTAWRNWGFRMNHATAMTSDPLIETATQTDQTTHTTGLGATWDLAERGSFDFSLNQNIRLTDAYSDSYSWSSQNWYDYPWRPKLRIGVGYGFGYDSIEPGTDMSNQRLNVRITGRLSDKVTFEVGGGGEMRFFYGSDAETALSPLVNASLGYQVLERTSLSLGFSRDVNVSYFSDQYTENTSIQGGVVQVLSDRWSVFANGGYRFTKYQQATAGTATTREDGSAFARAGFSGRVAARITASLAYVFSGNSSDQDAYAFDSHQVSLQLNWAL